MGCVPAHCCAAGCDGELGTNWFAGNDCTVARVRQGDEEQSSTEPLAPGLICWQTEDRDHVSPVISKSAPNDSCHWKEGARTRSLNTGEVGLVTQVFPGNPDVDHRCGEENEHRADLPIPPEAVAQTFQSNGHGHGQKHPSGIFEGYSLHCLSLLWYYECNLEQVLHRAPG